MELKKIALATLALTSLSACKEPSKKTRPLPTNPQELRIGNGNNTLLTEARILSGVKKDKVRKTQWNTAFTNTTEMQKFYANKFGKNFSLINQKLMFSKRKECIVPNVITKNNEGIEVIKGKECTYRP
jgi:hypothetical protein